MVNRFNGLKWNTDVVLWHEVEYGFKVKRCRDYHLRLLHPILGWFNYYPSTGKAQWDGCKFFVIKDIEKYLQSYFKPN